MYKGKTNSSTSHCWEIDLQADERRQQEEAARQSEFKKLQDEARKRADQLRKQEEEVIAAAEREALERRAKQEEIDRQRVSHTTNEMFLLSIFYNKFYYKPHLTTSPGKGATANRVRTKTSARRGGEASEGGRGKTPERGRKSEAPRTKGEVQMPSFNS